MRVRRLGGVAALAAAVVFTLAAPSPAYAERSAGGEFGLGVGSLLLSLPYGLVKTVYAVGGIVVGGLGWTLTGGRNDVARAIWQPALRGDYVITPEVLTGQKPLTFVGRDPRSEPYPY